MNNPYYQMMINNAREFVKSNKYQPDIENQISIFEISEVLAICTGKLKEDIVIEISGLDENNS